MKLMWGGEGIYAKPQFLNFEHVILSNRFKKNHLEVTHIQGGGTCQYIIYIGKASQYDMHTVTISKWSSSPWSNAIGSLMASSMPALMNPFHNVWL